MIKIANETPREEMTDNLADLNPEADHLADDNAVDSEILSRVGQGMDTNETEPVDEPEATEKIEAAPPGRIEVTKAEFFRINLLMQDFFEAEQETEQAEAVVNYLSLQLKEAKSTLERCEATKTDLFGELRRVHRGDSISDLANSLVVKPEASASGTGNTEANTDTAWQAVSIAVVFDPPIPGCGPKKVDAIEHEVGTLGTFEDLRAEAGNKNVKLHTLLPKGIGEDLANELEERHLAAIANPDITAATSDDSSEAEPEEPATEEVASGEATETVEADFEPVAEEPTPEAKPRNKRSPKSKKAKANQTAGTTLEPQLSEADEAEAERQQVLSRVEELRAEVETEIAEGVESNDDENWQNGRRAAIDGEPATECNWMPGEKQDGWLKGWLHGELNPDLDDIGSVDGDDDDDLDDI